MHQGLSSAYGAVNTRRDLDINDLLELCGKPDKIEDRIDLVKRYAVAYPEFKFFLIVAHFCRDSFSQILSLGPLNYIESKVPKGGSTENMRSMWNEITKMYDTFPTGPRTKRGRAQRLLGDLYSEDARIVYSLISGTFESKRVNELVVQGAFPDLCPKA